MQHLESQQSGRRELKWYMGCGVVATGWFPPGEKMPRPPLIQQQVLWSDKDGNRNEYLRQRRLNRSCSSWNAWHSKDQRGDQDRNCPLLEWSGGNVWWPWHRCWSGWGDQRFCWGWNTHTYHVTLGSKSQYGFEAKEAGRMLKMASQTCCGRLVEATERK